MKTSLMTILTVSALMAAIPAFAVDLSVDQSEDNSSGEDRNMSIKDSIEKKTSTIRSTAHDATTATSNRRTHTIDKSTNSTLSIAPSALLPSFRLKYKLAVEFGLAVDASSGRVNATAQEYIEQSWKSNALVSQICDSAEVERYIEQVAKTGLVAAQAEIYLQERIARLSATRSVNKKGKKVLNSAATVGIDDLPPLAIEAWKDADKDVSSPRLIKLWTRIQEERKNNPCKLYAGNSIACGNLVITISSPPKLMLDTIAIFDGSTFGGITGDIKISANTSLSAAYDKSKSVSDSVRRSVDNLDANGHAFEAAMARRDAMNSTTSNKAGLSAGKFIPGK